MKNQHVLRNSAQGDSSSKSLKIAPRKNGERPPRDLRTRYFIEFVGRGSSLSAGSSGGSSSGSFIGSSVGGTSGSSSSSASSGAASSSSSSSSGSSSPIGHAFVKWIKVDPDRRIPQQEAFGFYNKGVWFINTPGKIQDDNNESGLVTLRVEVTGPQFKNSLNTKEDWRKRADAGEFKYDLAGFSCIDFADKIARSLGLQVPSYEHILEVRNLFRLPITYIAELLELNKTRNVSAAVLRPMP